MIGVELTEPARPIAEMGLAHGALFNLVQGNVLRLLPSFLLERRHVNFAMDVLQRYFDESEPVPTLQESPSAVEVA